MSLLALIPFDPISQARAHQNLRSRKTMSVSLKTPGIYRRDVFRSVSAFCYSPIKFRRKSTHD
jgi:hypothetical protein